jgi:hypothetical protein
MMGEYKSDLVNTRSFIATCLVFIFLILPVYFYFKLGMSGLIFYGFCSVAAFLLIIYAIIQYSTSQIVIEKGSIGFKSYFSKSVNISKNDVKATSEGFYYNNFLARLSIHRSLSEKSKIYDYETYGIKVSSDENRIFIDRSLFKSSYSKIKEDLAKTFADKKAPNLFSFDTQNLKTSEENVAQQLPPIDQKTRIVVITILLIGLLYYYISTYGFSYSGGWFQDILLGVIVGIFSAFIFSIYKTVEQRQTKL